VTNRTAAFAFALMICAAPAHAQNAINFPHSMVISHAAIQAAAQTPPSGAAAQPPANAAQPGARMALTLDEAVKLALDHNLDISVQRLNRATFDVALESVQSVYNPTVNTTISNLSNKQAGTNTISGATATGQAISTQTAQFNAGVAQNVPWHGGSYNLSFNNTRQSTTSQNALYNPQYNGQLQAQYTQPVLRNFSIDTNRQQLLITKINTEISDLQVQQTVTNTMANTRNAYWDYVFAVQSVEVEIGRAHV